MGRRLSACPYRWSGFCEDGIARHGANHPFVSAGERAPCGRPFRISSIGRGRMQPAMKTANGGGVTTRCGTARADGLVLWLAIRVHKKPPQGAWIQAVGLFPIRVVAGGLTSRRVRWGISSARWQANLGF